MNSAGGESPFTGRLCGQAAPFEWAFHNQQKSPFAGWRGKPSILSSNFIISVELQSNYCLNVLDKDEIWRKVCDSARSIWRKCCDTLSTGSKRVTIISPPLFCLHPLSTYPLISVVIVAEKGLIKAQQKTNKLDLWESFPELICKFKVECLTQGFQPGVSNFPHL